MTAIAKKPNLTAEGLGRLANDFQIKPNITRILASWLNAVKRADDLAVDVLYAHILRTAIGVQLDRAGAIIGESRNGSSDETYRAVLQTSARARASTGIILDTYEITALVIGSQAFDYVEGFPANYTVIVYSFPAPALVVPLARLLGYAKPAGFCGRLVTSPLPAASVLQWGRTSGEPGVGFASASFPSAFTSTYAHAREIKA